MFTTALVHEHEIAKNHDFQFAFESILRNTTILDKMLVSANRSWVIGGEVIAETTGSMNVYVRPVWANGRSLVLPAFSDMASSLIFIQPPTHASRIDIIEVRGVLEAFDLQRRAFFEPELENGRYHNVETKVRLVNEIKVVHGEEGNPTAPPVDDGYVKLAEIIVLYGENVIENSQIKNITALVNNEENIEWTNNIRSSFYLGSLSDIKMMFGLEHNKDGTHRAGSIKLPYLKIGHEPDALNADVIPLGKGYVVNQDEWLQAVSIYIGLKNESIIRARDDEIERLARIAKDWELEQRLNALELMLLDYLGKLSQLWDAVFADMTSNPFRFSFADLDGITLIRGNWNETHHRLECTYVERTFNFTFENLDRIELIRGNWNQPHHRLENTLTERTFSFSFNSLDRIELIRGIWNPALNRIEC
jgi:hypothetical protein